jgi:dTDP-4-dehydrorhamnose reductase
VRILVTGAGGQVGREVVGELVRRAAERRRGPALEVIGLERARLDVSRRDLVLGAVGELEPDVIIHAAAMTAVDRCESEPDAAFSANALACRHIAEAARLVGAHVCAISTDYVFDGRSPRPYHEWDEPHPLSVYGASKLAGERELGPGATIARTSWVCGRFGANMAKTVLRLVAGSGALRFVDDQRGSPTVAADLASMLVTLALERRPGVFHVTNQGETTWYDFARAVVEAAGGDPARVVPISTADLDPPRPAARPANSVLENRALRLSGIAPLPHWRDAVGRLVAELADAAR